MSKLTRGNTLGKLSFNSDIVSQRGPQMPSLIAAVTQSRLFSVAARRAERGNFRSLIQKFIKDISVTLIMMIAM